MATKRTSTPVKDSKKTAPKKPVAVSRPAPAKKVVVAKAPAAAKPAAKKAAVTKPVAPVKKGAAKPVVAPAKKVPVPAAKAAASPAKAPAKKEPAKPAPAKGKAPVVSVRLPPKKAVKGKGALAGGIKPYQSKKGEDYMNESHKAHFRALLQAWKSELMEEVDRTVSHMKDEAANFPDPADRATQEEEFSLELRARDRERKLIKKIDSTLELIDEDEYGYCEACGIEIGIQRLEARPTATQCIDCKTLSEIKEKQVGA
jgi:DnaK suppressor protein